MSLTSPGFLGFIFLVYVLNQLVSGQYKRYVLLMASIVFIASFNVPSLIAVILFSTFNFLVARKISTDQNPILFYLTITINSLAIIVFNYMTTFGGSLVFSFTSIEFKTETFLLIIGLSFYNLQHIAYVIDVYKKRIVAETNYFDFLLMSAYFPKFVSGPITTFQELKPQLYGSTVNKGFAWQGFNRILLGFFKKMVIADRLAPSISSVFDYNDNLPGITIITGAILFTIQLYFDFSGYCDIAIGASKLIGIELPENFDLPLRATSITVFWRKWHRTLIRFFTTYIFYPVSFKYRRLKKYAVALAVLFTFFVSAVWHGIGITFMLWAFCHACYLWIELFFRKNGAEAENQGSILKKIVLSAIVLVLVSFSNIFFRATSLENCKHLLSNLFCSGFFPEDWWAAFIAPIAIGGHQADHFNLLVTILFVVITLIFERRIFDLARSERFRPLITLAVLLLIFLFGVFSNGQRFVYMQF